MDNSKWHIRAWMIERRRMSSAVSSMPRNTGRVLASRPVVVFVEGLDVLGSGRPDLADDEMPKDSMSQSA